ncbi:hypothetical protein PIROE2DRAFT_7312, partial [Piromyces sp. E2]
ENSTIYNIPVTLKLNNNVDIENIKSAFEKIFQNHEILRSKYHEKEVDGKIEIYGFIDDECYLTFEEYNYDNYHSFVRPFDLSVAPLIRVGFISNEVLMIDCHHIISDGGSLTIIMKELEELYNNQDIPSLEIQFSDYAYYLTDKKNNGYYEKQLSYYQEMFKCDYEIVQLPVKENNKEENVGNVGKYERIINKSMTESINKFVKGHGISKTAFFTTIYGYILSKYSGQDTIYTSIMNANRNNYYVENMIGMFVSTQPILLKYNKIEKSFIEIMKENMNILIDVYNNIDLSLVEIIKALKLKKVNNGIIYQPYIKSERNDKNENYSYIFADDNNNSNNNNNNNNNDDEKPEMYDINNNTVNNYSKFDTLLFVVDKNEEILLSVEFDNKKYNSVMIHRLIDSIVEIIKNIDTFENYIQDIEYMPEKEKEMVLETFNNDEYHHNSNQFYHEEFSKMVKSKQNECALVYNDINISYRKLEEMSNSLAHYLRLKSINRNDIIPIISERSYHSVVSQIAISKAGGAFLPIDPKLPIDRIEFILREVNPKLILYYHTESIIDKISHDKYDVYNLENHNYEENIFEINNINKPDDTCYVLFTSGTTGKPKGVLVSHFNIYNNVRTFEDEKSHVSLYNLLKESQQEIHNILGITNFSFDITHNEIMYSLIHGLKIILVDDELTNNMSLLIDYMEKHNVDMINTTPTRLKLFMENEPFKNLLGTIKVIVLSGEELPITLCKEIRKYSKCKIYNGYGPTECYFCTYKKIERDWEKQITIGKPICNYKIYILDKYMKPVPIGVEGEIFISGYGVGKGYLNREELTKEKFIRCPFNNNGNVYNEIMYKTGDNGKWTENGEIIYLGRIDFQIKIRGQRIELGEIESIIKEIDEIKNSVVIDKKKENGEQYLVSYYIREDGKIVNGKEIRNYLKMKLPTYMIPNYFKEIEEIPLTISGKLNRKELPEPCIEDLIKEEYVAPETETEKKLCNIYGEIFNISENEIGQLSDFYELGGDSLNAIRLISKIEKEFSIKIGMKNIINNSSIHNLSKYIDDLIENGGNENQIEKIEKRNKKEFPITSQQLGIYLDSVKNESSTIYNIPTTIKLNNNVDIEKIKLAFEKIFQNQDILRSKYHEKEVDGKIEIYGFIDDECSLTFEEYNYDNYNSFVRPFDLSVAPLIRVGFISNEVLMIDCHHIISDGGSMTIIMKELEELYNNQDIPSLEIQFSDYAYYLNENNNTDRYSKSIVILQKYV